MLYVLLVFHVLGASAILVNLNSLLGGCCINGHAFNMGDTKNWIDLFLYFLTIYIPLCIH